MAISKFKVNVLKTESDMMLVRRLDHGSIALNRLSQSVVTVEPLK